MLRNILVGLFCSTVCSFSFGAEPVPLVQAHAHNDYLHARPLLDALDHGFCSVEADIHLVDGKLLVAHDRPASSPERTLEALYLEPLRERAKKNGGRIYPRGPEFTLLIDLKSDWHTTYPVLRQVLNRYAEMLVQFRDGKKQTNAVLVVLSGNRSLEMFAGESLRLAAYDGLLSDLGSTNNSSLIPWISSNWSTTFTWTGSGEMPEEQREKLRQIVAKAHGQNRRVRFWGAPDREVFWREMLAADVDLINTDNLEGLQKVLAGK